MLQHQFFAAFWFTKKFRVSALVWPKTKISFTFWSSSLSAQLYILGAASCCFIIVLWTFLFSSTHWDGGGLILIFLWGAGRNSCLVTSSFLNLLPWLQAEYLPFPITFRRGIFQIRVPSLLPGWALFWVVVNTSNINCLFPQPLAYRFSMWQWRIKLWTLLLERSGGVSTHTLGKFEIGHLNMLPSIY